VYGRSPRSIPSHGDVADGGLGVDRDRERAVLVAGQVPAGANSAPVNRLGGTVRRGPDDGDRARCVEHALRAHRAEQHAGEPAAAAAADHEEVGPLRQAQERLRCSARYDGDCDLGHLRDRVLELRDDVPGCPGDVLADAVTDLLDGDGVGGVERYQ
jgi:hypothetical protein